MEESPDVVVDHTAGLGRAALLGAVADADALIVRSATQVDAELIEAAPKLKVVGRAGVGVDNVDLEAATRRGIVVTNTPAANTIATVEQTLALMLAAARHVARAHTSVAEGRWERGAFTGRELFGRTLGIVGLGRIGREVAHRTHAFGMRVLAADPYISELTARDVGVELVDLDELLVAADVITLHAVSPPGSPPLLDSAAFARVKSGAMVVNAARGSLIDARAAAAALDAGRLSALAIDVYDQEPPPASHPLVGRPDVIHTPHLGASTVEAQRAVSIQVVGDVLAALRGDPIENAVNVPFQLDTDAEVQLRLAEAIGRLHAALAPRAIARIDVEVANATHDLTKTVAAGFLSGLLRLHDAAVNYVSAPQLAAERGLVVSEGSQIATLDYPNLMSCRVGWDGGGRTVSGVVFVGKEPRIVAIDDYHLDARPEGVVLVLQSRDVPGVIAEVAAILGAHGVNVAEWRLGRDTPGGRAVSFINLDSMPSPGAIEAIRGAAAVDTAIAVAL
ncbi:MAG: phosphoglycerate dehydrogenase [Acidimicrobiales bacterium]